MHFVLKEEFICAVMFMAFEFYSLIKSESQLLCNIIQTYENILYNI